MQQHQTLLPVQSGSTQIVKTATALQHNKVVLLDAALHMQLHRVGPPLFALELLTAKASVCSKPTSSISILSAYDS
jgi:hypothetical protein